MSSVTKLFSHNPSDFSNPISVSISFKKPKKLHGKILCGFRLEMVSQTVKYFGPDTTYGEGLYVATFKKPRIGKSDIEKLRNKLKTLGFESNLVGCYIDERELT